MNSPNEVEPKSGNDRICIKFCFGNSGRGYVQGWSTFGRSGSSPFDVSDSKSVAKATMEIIEYLADSEPVIVTFDKE